MCAHVTAHLNTDTPTVNRISYVNANINQFALILHFVFCFERFVSTFTHTCAYTILIKDRMYNYNPDFY